jgi:hypothetical protein
MKLASGLRRAMQAWIVLAYTPARNVPLRRVDGNAGFAAQKFRLGGAVAGGGTVACDGVADDG